MPGCAIGGVLDDDAGCLQLVADFVGEGEVFVHVLDRGVPLHQALIDKSTHQHGGHRLGDGLGYGFLDICKEESVARVDIVLDRLLNLVLDLVLLEVFLEEREVHPIPTI